MGATKIIITCEHADNYIPKSYELLFKGHEEVLESHRGWDPGALKVAKYMSKQLSAPLFYHKVCRLVIDVNRSVGHNQLYSEYTVNLDEYVKKHLLESYYLPYRNQVEAAIKEQIDAGFNVMHLSIHTFTPSMNGVERMVDIGVLYDENRPEEVAFAEQITPAIQKILPEKVVMYNCPYHGADDGFTTYLRTRFSSSVYKGIELEINQKYVDIEDVNYIKKALSDSVLSFQLKAVT